MLKETHHQDALVTCDDIFGTVAVVHIKIDDRHALQAVTFQRVLGCNGNVVEETKTHGLVATGVVSRRTNRAKSGLHLACQHRIRGSQGGASGPQRRVPGADVDRSIRVNRRVGGATCLNFLPQVIAQTTQCSDIHATMRQFNVCQRGDRRLASVQRNVQT